MAKAIIILEDRQDGTGLIVNVDFDGKFDDNSGAHLMADIATRSIVSEARKANANVSRSDDITTH